MSNRAKVRLLWGLLLGVLTLSAWATWVIMLGIGSLASLGVVNETVSFHEAAPLGVGAVAFVFMPFLFLLASLSEQ